MQKSIVSALLAVASALPVITEAAQASGHEWGVWTSSGRTHTFAFLDNNELTLWGEVRHTRFEIDGAWQYQEGICGPDDKQHTGNVMIYVDTVQCCVAAQFLGKKLVLTEVWTKGTGVAYGFCSNQVLTKVE